MADPLPPSDLWRAISRATLDPDDDEEGEVEGEGEDDTNGDSDGNDDHNMVPRIQSHHARDRDLRGARHKWTQRFQGDVEDQSNDHLLFGPLREDIQLSASHPEQVQIFRLWQIYLDNVNPLLKVTHTPTLQSRIIDAVSDVTSISSGLEALIFSIYCVSVVSLDEKECLSLFRSPRKELLAGYQFACQQALRKCGAWRSSDLDGLTALYLYLVSARPQTDARSLSCMLAVAIRTAQRMGMHNQSAYAGLTALEAEMRRRLWWSLVFFDHRICEVADYRTTTLTPVWDCSTPLNVNDFEIRADTRTSPTAHDKPTEAVFAVIRNELADFVRHSVFHLNFVNPSLNAIAQFRNRQHGLGPEAGELIALERTIEEKYLAFCNPEDPLHYMTIWTTRGFLARNRLLEHYSRHSTPSVRPTDAQRNVALDYALSMLECDTKLRTSPLTKGYLWLVDFHPPALAYLHILNDMRKRPAIDLVAGKAWDVIGNNYESLVARLTQQDGREQGVYRIFTVFSHVILQAWDARGALLVQQRKPSERPPRIVSDIKEKMVKMSPAFSPQPTDVEQPGTSSLGFYNAASPSVAAVPMELSNYPGTEGRQGFGGPGPAGYFSDIPDQTIMDAEMDQLWTEMDRGWMNGAQGW